MGTRTFALVAGILLLLLGGAVAVAIYDDARKDTIAKGVRVAGIDVGGMTSAQARRTLRRDLVARLVRPVTVRWHGRAYRITARQARVRADVASSVQDALERSREGNAVTRTWRGLTGGAVHADLQPQLSWSRAAVRRFVARVGGDVDRAVREADVSFGPSGPRIRRGRAGRRLARQRLTAQIRIALADPGSARTVRPKVVRLPPRRTTAEVARRYPTVLVVDRTRFQLRVYKGLRLRRSYTVAVGQQGLDTPAGLYHIQNKAVDPTWHIPNSAWAGSEAGRIVPPGPDNPLKARWLGIFNGAGIHGTDETWSLGHAASHGCVRMAISDVIQLYDETPVGAPIYIA